MNEIKEAIILAAGSSRRMGLLCEGKHKSLLKYKDQTILSRVINQLKKANIEKIIIVVGFAKDKIIEETKNIADIEIQIVENPRYFEDTNIYSMKLALDHIENPFIIVEADMIAEDSLLQYLAGSDFEGKSTWLTKGKFNDTQYGGILRSDELGNINDIRIVPEYREEYKNHTKLTGLMRVGPNEIDLFKKLVNIYAEKTFKQYFLIPWIENLNHLPCIEGNASQYKFSTFNSPEDYYKAVELEFDEEQPKEKEINFIETEKLKHIENFDEERVNILVEKIEKDGAWLKPIYIEKNHNLVLDGQHRLQAAIRMGIKKIPTQGFNYEDVKVWTLRKEEYVDIPTVIARANQGDIYPYKTVKHNFPRVISECYIPLENLKGEILIEKENKSKRLIILAAGQGFKVHGLNKLFIKDPKNQETLIEKYSRLFKDYEITVVLGHKALHVMQEYPHLNYVYNDQWRITGNSYSLSLALDDRPTIVTSSDLIFDEEMLNLIESSPDNSVFVFQSENKGYNTVRCKSEEGIIKDMFFGEDFSNEPETTGIFKISNPDILREWKKRCLNNKNVFAGINLPLENFEINIIDIKDIFFHEINTPLDYINLIEKTKNGS